MTTLQLNIPDQQAVAPEAYAQARGLTVEQWLLELVEHAVSTARPALPDAATMSNQERAQEFVAWARLEGYFQVISVNASSYSIWKALVAASRCEDLEAVKLH